MELLKHILENIKLWLFSWNFPLSPVNVAKNNQNERNLLWFYPRFFSGTITHINHWAHFLSYRAFWIEMVLICRISKWSPVQWSEAPSLDWRSFLCPLFLEHPCVADSRDLVPLFPSCLCAAQLLPVLLTVILWSPLHQAQQHLPAAPWSPQLLLAFHTQCQTGDRPSVRNSSQRKLDYHFWHDYTEDSEIMEEKCPVDTMADVNNMMWIRM